MNLYFLDNGGEYSDHVVYFVEDPGYTRVQVEALVRLLDSPGTPKFTVLGCGDVTWFGGKLMTFEALVDRLSWRLDNWEGDDLPLGRQHASLLPPELLKMLPQFLR